MDPKVNLNMEITIEKGRGYVPAEENKKPGAPFGTIFTDSIYTPIKNVKYSIENRDIHIAHLNRPESRVPGIIL